MILTRIEALERERCKRSFQTFLFEYARTYDRDGNDLAFPRWPYLENLAGLLTLPGTLVIEKARQMLITWEVALFVYWTMEFFPRTKCGWLSLDKEEAGEAIERIRYSRSKLPRHLRTDIDKDNVQELSLANGSKVRAFASGRGKKGRSLAGKVIVADEAAFQEHFAQNYTACKPAVDAGGHLIVPSTHDGPFTRFHELCQEAKRPDKPATLRHVLLPWTLHPGRDRAWKRESMAGYENEREWEQEYECKTFVRKGNVFSIDPQLHVKDFIPQKIWQHYAGLDFGQDHPTVYADLFEDEKGTWYVVDEVYERSILSKDLAASIKDRWKVWGRPRSIFADKAAASERRELAANGVETEGAGKDVIGRVKVIERLLRCDEKGEPRLIFHPRVRKIFAEFSNLVWNARTGQPEKKRDDGYDAASYGIYSAESIFGQEFQFSTSPRTGNASATRQVGSPVGIGGGIRSTQRQEQSPFTIGLVPKGVSRAGRGIRPKP